MSLWKLARQIASQGADISAELARAKWDFAQARLVHREQSIEEIYTALSYSDPANFSRAFA
jgi:AraC-like DNA-binding protein